MIIQRLIFLSVQVYTNRGKVIGIMKNHSNILKEALLEAINRNCGLKKSPVGHREKIVVEQCQ